MGDPRDWGGAAALAHPADDEVNGRLAGSGAGRFFAPGKYIGTAYAQAGTAVGLYVIGHSAEAKAAPSSISRSHLYANRDKRWSTDMAGDTHIASARAAHFTRGLQDARLISSKSAWPAL